MRLAILVAVLGGCAHAPDLGLRMDPSPPAGSTAEEVAAPDGTKLLARTWAASGEIRGVVVIVHGLKDHSARYAAFAAQLAAAGYEVRATDLRGHGRSAGPRVAPARWTDYVDDLDAELSAAEAAHPGVPVFVLGHSMGGAIATLTAERHQPQIAGLVLSAPALAIDAAPLLIAATRLSGWLMPRFPALDLDNHDFSSDPEAAKAMGEDPLIAQDPGPAKTAAGLVDGMREIWAGVAKLTMPLLAMHGTRDKLTAPSGSRALVRAAPSADKRLRVYSGLAHDLLHEPGDAGGALVAKDVLAWLDAHTGGDALEALPLDGERLGGDPRGWTQAITLGVGVGGGSSTSMAAVVDVQLARPRPFGWHGGVSFRFAPDVKSVAVRPLGFAVRVAGTTVGASVGAAWLVTSDLGVSSELWVEQSAGPVHVGLVAEHDVRLTGEDPRMEGALSSDALWVGGSVRYGEDRRYWPRARAGVGPALVGGVDVTAAQTGWFVMAGLQMYGAD